MAAIIREVMTEFGAVGPGYSINDPEVDHIYEAYREPGRCYLVVTAAGKVLGGAGIAPLEGANAPICELKKMYFRPALRGRGLATPLLQQLLVEARTEGYQQCYLETVARMEAANRFYRRMGFQPLDKPMGDTGHNACDLFYLIDL